VTRPADRIAPTDRWVSTISQIVQVTALFNYYNRVADGLGIDHEPGWPQ
jgi:hypothetical protein